MTEASVAPANPAATGMLVAAHAAAEPGRLGIVKGDDAITYGELNSRANKLARALRARGLVEGDGVVIMVSNRSEFAEVYAATQRTGMRLTTVNWHLTAGEAAYLITDCEARAIVAEV